MENLETIFNLSWELRTCYKDKKHLWNENEPYIGQCAISALIVNDLLGADIMKVKVGKESHYYNILDGEIIDYTKFQYKSGSVNYADGKLVFRDELLSDSDTRHRYYILAKNFKYNSQIFTEESNKSMKRLHEFMQSERIDD